MLGGRAMEVVYSEDELRTYMDAAVSVSNDSPVLLDHFLDSAVEVDVDAVCDGTNIAIGAIMEHIEQAGVHSGDSACSLPPNTLDPSVQEQLRDQVRKLARGLNVIGLMNTQFAIQGKDIYLLEVNPRASRTVPFVSKATGRPLAKIAALCMVGKSPSRSGRRTRTDTRLFLGQGPGFPLRAIPRCGSDTGSGDEVDRGGHGYGSIFW